MWNARLLKLHIVLLVPVMLWWVGILALAQGAELGDGYDLDKTRFADLVPIGADKDFLSGNCEANWTLKVVFQFDSIHFHQL